MSSDKTTNLALHKWAGTDPVERTEFNDNFGTIDSKIGEHTTQIAETNTGLNVLQRGIGKTKKPIITFTLDDGQISDYTKIKPIFISKGVPCTLGIITDRIGLDSTYMTVSQIKELEGLGWEIASHTKTHADLTTLTDEQLAAEVGGSKSVLEALGFNKVNNLLYPYGSSNEKVRASVRKYYRCATKVGGGLNTGVLNTFSLNRTAMGAYYDDGNEANTGTLAYYKSKVDEAITNKSWVVFMLHPQAMSNTQLTYLSQLIDYIQSLSISILTLNDALDVVGNVIDAGDTTTKFSVAADGSVVATSLSTQQDYQILSSTGFSNSSPLSSFPDETVSTMFFTVAQNGGFPQNAGVLETYRIGDIYFSFQQFYHFSSNKIYKRTWNYTTSSWNAWEQIAGLGNVVNHVANNAFTATSAITAYDVEKITVFVVSGANTAGFPNNAAGTCFTYRLINFNGYDYQEYKTYNAFDKFIRYVKDDGSWSAWKQYSLV